MVIIHLVLGHPKKCLPENRDFDLSGRAERRTCTFLGFFSSKSTTSGHLFHSVFSADTFFSAMCSQAQNAFNDASSHCQTVKVKAKQK